MNSAKEKALKYLGKVRLGMVRTKLGRAVKVYAKELDVLVNEMEADGLILIGVIKNGKPGPAPRVYTLTQQGRGELRRLTTVN